MRRAGDGHLDPDGLAEFRAGLITGRRGARISAHLAACERCTALDGELTRVSALLSAVQVPAMPDGVAQRLDLVLAAEVAKHDFPERAGQVPSGDPEARPRTARTRDFRWISLRVLAPATAVVLAATGYGLSQLSGPQQQFNSASSGSLPSPTSSVPGVSGVSGGSRVAGGQAAPAARGVSSSAASARPTYAGLAQPQRKSPIEITVVISRTNFLPGTVKQQVEADMSRPSALRKTEAASRAVRACVLHLAASDSLLLVEAARFEGQPATVVVIRTNQGDLALVAGSGCSATGRDVQASTTVPAGISGP